MGRNLCSSLIAGCMGRQPWLGVSVTARDGVKQKDLWCGELDGAEKLPKIQGCWCGCVSCFMFHDTKSRDLVS